MVYLGPVKVDQLEDARTYCRGDVKPDLRASFRGRWGTYVTRDPMLGDLAKELERRSHREAAEFYLDQFAAYQRSGK